MVKIVIKEIGYNYPIPNKKIYFLQWKKMYYILCYWAYLYIITFNILWYKCEENNISVLRKYLNT